MKQVISALQGFAIQATDGPMGGVADFLFDETTWKVRWLVVECGTWLRGRKVLLHPSAISATGAADRRFEVNLSKAEVEASPDVSQDEPVSGQMEARLYSHYDVDPMWGAPNLAAPAGAIASPFLAAPYFGAGADPSADRETRLRPEGETHLRGFAEVVGYRIDANDGEIGHLENLVLDDADWSLVYLVVDTSNWWFGKRVLIAPVAVLSIDWLDRRIRLDVSRETVQSSPIWDPLAAFDEMYSKRLHSHYGWPGSGV
jgi:hypothetical protein